MKSRISLLGVVGALMAAACGERARTQASRATSHCYAHWMAWFEVGINSLRERNKVTKLNKLHGPSRLTRESAGTDSGLVTLPSTKCPFALDPNLSGEVRRNTSSVAKPIYKEGLRDFVWVIQRLSSRAGA